MRSRRAGQTEAGIKGLQVRIPPSVIAPTGRLKLFARLPAKVSDSSSSERRSASACAGKSLLLLSAQNSAQIIPSKFCNTGVAAFAGTGNV